MKQHRTKVRKYNRQPGGEMWWCECSCGYFQGWHHKDDALNSQVNHIIDPDGEDETDSEDYEQRRHNVADESGVRVMSEQCSTCIFRPGNLMHLQRGRVKGMVDDCLRDQTIIPCHKTLDDDKQAVCRGLYDRFSDEIWPLRFAKGTDNIVDYQYQEDVDVPKM